MTQTRPPRIGIGGPVGSGKTMLCLKLCHAMRERYSMAVVTNDIYTKEDAEYLTRSGALPAERIAGVETGGCPHTAIRDDTTMNEQAVQALEAAHPDLQLVLVESGGDNLSATFSPELADITIYVIDVSNINQIFDGNRSYAKGCIVLHMLRGVVGDSVFFNILRTYVADTSFAYKNAVTK